ncbi:hypothetical protein ACO22_01931 [Paracoccidioides brasiliensis]|uniref:Uncharacterized protein n=1 Tax=Paracoccidioides brasiliensis TaxID=121759 RepID=A0A1D2JK48_PARBR|nr:hypothetical protein ACO22_01931 [Paracoccidioides brasiliensis]
MGQKHNRRRTRPRTRRCSNVLQDQTASPVQAAFTCRQSSSELKDPNSSSSTLFPYPFPESQPQPLAKHWHNRQISWQNCECRQFLEAAQLEADQCRLFGGEPGDDCNNDLMSLIHGYVIWGIVSEGYGPFGLIRNYISASNSQLPMALNPVRIKRTSLRDFLKHQIPEASTASTS